MIRRGTTPTHTFEIPFDFSFVKNIKIIYSQDDIKILTKSLADCTPNGKSFSVRLTQRETLNFAADKPVQIQIRLLTSAGDALSSTIEKVQTLDSLTGEILV